LMNKEVVFELLERSHKKVSNEGSCQESCIQCALINNAGLKFSHA